MEKSDRLSSTANFTSKKKPERTTWVDQIAKQLKELADWLNNPQPADPRLVPVKVPVRRQR